MIGRAEVRIVVEACSDAFSAIKPVLIIEDGCNSCTNKTVGIHLYPALFAGADPFIKRGTIQL